MRILNSLVAGLLVCAAAVAPAQTSTQLGPPSPTARPGTPAAPLTATSPASTTRPLTREDVDAWLDGYVPHALGVGDIPGAVVVVVQNGQVLTARGFGYADVARRVPVDPERTLFRPGSVSKLITWTAVMQLVEQHRLDLDQDVNRYLDFTIPPRNGQPITLRQILTHTAGFDEAGDRVVFYDVRNQQSLGDYLKTIVPPRVYDAGTTPAYSNWATALAGYIVQRTSGEDFDSYVERHVFAPLGMRSSTFRQPVPAALAGRVAVAYPQPGETSGFEFIGPAPAGSMSATGTDMARFMIAHLQGGQLGSGRILQPATVQIMHDSPLDRVNSVSLIPPLNRMELGFFQMDVGHPGVIGHLGDLNAFHTSLDLFQNENVGIYVSVNGSGRLGAGSALRLALPEDFAARYFGGPLPAPVQGVDAATAAEHARMMAGSWDASRRAHSSFFSVVYALGQTDVSVGPNGELVVPALLGAGGRPREWVEVAPFVWRDRFSPERLAAQVVDGRVVRWSFDMASPWEVFDRVPFARSMSWIKPLLYGSLAILLLTVLFWPASWLARRRHAASAPIGGRSLQTRRVTRILAAVELALLAGWASFVMILVQTRPSGSGIFVPWLWLLQIVGLVVLPGLVLVAGWNAWLSWREQQAWPRRLWSVLVVLAALHILYFAATFGLIAMTVDF